SAARVVVARRTAARATPPRADALGMRRIKTAAPLREPPFPCPPSSRDQKAQRAPIEATRAEPSASPRRCEVTAAGVPA
ncbi:MAG TPA: ATP-dependent helicase, partial [Brevundimonas diminuta]|nr:ATP-dependent helicase [Brevundimonas diminuta]